MSRQAKDIQMAIYEDYAAEQDDNPTQEQIDAEIGAQEYKNEKEI